MAAVLSSSGLHQSPRAADMSAVDRWLLREQFGTKSRKRIYNSLGVLVDNNVLMMAALQDIYAACSDDGRKPKAAQAIIVGDLMDQIADGVSLADALSSWVDPQEASVIAAGEQSGGLRAALKDAIDLLESRDRIRAASRALMIYPGALGLMMVGVMTVISVVVVPKLSAIADPSQWERFARMLYLLSEFVLNYGLWVMLMIVAGIAWTAWSMANLTGTLRQSLDNIPPWSIYRQIQGSIFLLNLASMLKAGVKLFDSLEISERHATPWLQERVRGAVNGTSVGLNFGEALSESGYGFPDRESIRYLRTLSGLDGFDKSLSDYAQSSLEVTTQKVEAGAKVLMVCAIALIVMFVLLVVGAISDIQAAIDAGINR